MVGLMRHWPGSIRILDLHPCFLSPKVCDSGQGTLSLHLNFINCEKKVDWNIKSLKVHPNSYIEQIISTHSKHFIYLINLIFIKIYEVGYYHHHVPSEETKTRKA